MTCLSFRPPCTEPIIECIVVRVLQSDADCKLFSVWGILPGLSHAGADFLCSSSSLWRQPGEVCCTHIHTLCNTALRAEESSSRVILPLSNRLRVCSFSKRVSIGVSFSFGREANSLRQKTCDQGVHLTDRVHDFYSSPLWQLPFGILSTRRIVTIIVFIILILLHFFLPKPTQ